jgi:hypothetical protein
MIVTASIVECVIMKASVNSKRVLFTVPLDVREWLEERAKYHGGTISGEAVRSIRERMERERAKDRATAGPPELA